MRDSRDGDDAIRKLDGYVTSACCCPELPHLHCCICIAAIDILTLLAWICRMEFGRRRRPLRVEWAKVGMTHILHLMMINYDALIHPLLHSPVCIRSCSGQTDTVLGFQSYDIVMHSRCEASKTDYMLQLACAREMEKQRDARRSAGRTARPQTPSLW